MRVVLVLAMLALLLAGCGDRGSVGGLLILDGRHRVDAGTTLLGDLLVLDGEVAIQAGARVSGSVFVLGGRVEIAGTVDGDIAVIGGHIRLADTAVVGGGLRQGGGQTDEAPGAQVGSELVSPVAVDAVISLTKSTDEGSGWTGRTLASLLVVAALAALAGLIMPRSLARMSDAVRSQPLVPMAVGLLGLIVGISFLTFMVFTVVLIPVALLLFVAGLTGTGLGVLSVGMPLVRRLLGRAAPTRWSAGLHAALAGSSLAAALALISRVPVLGELTLAAVLSMGLGTWLVTRFGTRDLVVTSP